MSPLRITAILGITLQVATAKDVAAVASPDGRNAIVVMLDDAGALSYRVERKGATVLESSPLGVILGGRDFTKGLTAALVSGIEERRETYSLFTGTRSTVDAPHRRRSVALSNAGGAAVTLDLDAGNEGVAFRYRFNGEGTETTVDRELSGFRLAAGARGWMQPYNQSSSSSPAHEDYFFAVQPGDPPPASRGGATRGWNFPALFEVPSAKSWLLLTESGTDESYCACHLAADSKNGVYQIEFPFADERTRGVPPREGTAPRHELPWTMPWRVMVLGDTAGDILTSTLVTDLAPPSKLADTSWIHPGRASWSWWAHPESQTPEERTGLYASYLRAGAAMGWEYSLLDAGWNAADMTTLTKLAADNHVALQVWAHAADFHDAGKRRAKLDEWQRLGITGVKIDFWCSDRQETLQAMMATLKDAAARRMTVNFHGCTLPRGWQRTFPNFLTAEAVLGAESYMFDDRYPDKAAELNTILPFTRNVAGPMDYTPLGLSAKRYLRKTTASHELAAALIFTSGIVHYADNPEVYAAFPEGARRILKDAPALWDETRCLIAEPGRAVVMARRSKESWFIAGINGTNDARTIDLDLKLFAGYGKRTLVHEGANATMELKEDVPATTDAWQGTMPPRGGFVLRLER